ncbi:WXG100 family type VII secretion target [Rhodococcus ruber]|uniref:WXG100 family type VII secretion target n=1 Tax=Rhodococcus TaxID=1827 RepID=UPI00058C9D0B|nr:WXG100 family type VII secretion target [Rhodococcus ruber]MCD2129686.1 WXG100 family type VII secretion target [Rhodococcus ruber]MCZ4506179.1 WXG100 family type VII secretion target [Rhodococcus ruber]MCZ4533278.1 WXG100 family type VII secretion target [Rhodococcus ruber]MCZ4620212.1 WXG100 family type VII secretion target [Rhodococcus ruber]MDI9970833.1 WXG100 family type VII secretion target [Rhodococcus ruber]
MSDVKTSPPRSLVESWNPGAVVHACADLDRTGELIDDGVDSLRREIDALHGNGAWRGNAQAAAADRMRRVRTAVARDAHAIHDLRATIAAGLGALEQRRRELRAVVADAEAAGVAVDDDWSIRAAESMPREVVMQWRQTIDDRRVAVEDADVAAAQDIVRAADALASPETIRGFVPVAIGVAVAVDAAAQALVAAGVVSLGALAFALVDRFGADAWEAISDAIPGDFFADSGPVDQDGVREVLRENTEPGRNKPNRQMATEEEIRDLYDRLAQEGRAIDTGSYAGRAVVLPDGTEVRIRESSSSGGTTIDVVFPNLRRMEVHVA